MKLFEVTNTPEWRDIPGWPYQVSTDGQVRNAAGQIIRPWKHKGKGGVVYYRVTLRNGGRRWNPRVHRLVAQAFIPNPDNLPEVDHIDHNPANNNVNNLQWVTGSENVSRQPRHQRPTLKDRYGDAGDIFD